MALNAFLSSPLTIQPFSLFIGACMCFSFGLSFFLWRAGPGSAGAKNTMALVSLLISMLALAVIMQAEIPALRGQVYYLVSIQMLTGPLLYFYVLFQTRPNFTLQATHLWHLSPLLIFTLIWHWQMPVELNHSLALPCFSNELCDVYRQNRYLHKVAAWVSNLAYGFIIIGILKSYQVQIKRRFSNIEEINLRWVTMICWCYILGTLLAILFEAGYFLGNEFNSGHMHELAMLVTTVLIAHYGVRQVTIHAEENEEPQNQPIESVSSSNKKYQTSSLTEVDAASLWQQLQQLMVTEKPYLEAGLKVSDLAKRLDVSVSHVSETINGHAGLSFYDFINKQRIEAAIRILEDPNKAHLSATEVGFEAGFNSVSTFYSHFKNYQGCTPKQYRSNQSAATVSLKS